MPQSSATTDVGYAPALEALPWGEAAEALVFLRDSLVKDAATLWVRARSLSTSITATERVTLRSRSKLLMRHAGAIEAGRLALLTQNRTENAAPPAGSCSDQGAASPDDDTTER